MILSLLQGHLPVVALFKCNFFLQLCSRWQGINWLRLLCSPSTIAEVLVDGMLLSLTAWLRWLYEKTRLPLIPIYGGFPVKMMYVSFAIFMLLFCFVCCVMKTGLVFFSFFTEYRPGQTLTAPITETCKNFLLFLQIYANSVVSCRRTFVSVVHGTADRCVISGHRLKTFAHEKLVLYWNSWMDWTGLGIPSTYPMLFCNGIWVSPNIRVFLLELCPRHWTLPVSLHFYRGTYIIESVINSFWLTIDTSWSYWASGHLIYNTMCVMQKWEMKNSQSWNSSCETWWWLVLG